MKRSHWMTAAAFALAVSAPAAWAAPADESPLSWVPATAPIVLHANGPQALRDHVVAFLKNALPDQADRVEKHLDKFLEDGFEGRKIRGLAKDGPVFVVFTELPKPESFTPDGPPPHLAILAAVASYAEFRDNILTDDEKKSLKKGDGYESTTPATGTGGVFLVDRKDFVVIAPTKEMAEAFVKAPAAGLDGKLGKGPAARFLASDLGVYVDMEAVNKEYGEQIKSFHTVIEGQLDKLEASLGTAQKSQFETVKKMIGPIFQAVEDGKSALFTAEVGPESVRLHAEAAVRGGTPTAGLLKTAKIAAFADLDKLPAGQVFYSGMELDPTLLKLAGSLLTGLSTDPDAKGAKEFQEAFDDWIKAGPNEAVSSVTYPVAGLGVLQCADADKAVAASVKMLQAMGSEGGFMNVYFKDKPEIKPNAEKYGAVSFTSVHMVWDLDKSLAAAGAQLPDAFKKQMAEGMKKLMGEEVNVWIGTDGKSVIQVTAKDWESAQKTLDQYFKGQGTVGEDKAFTAARKLLPKQASAVVVVDVVQYVGDILDFITPILQSSGAPGLPAKFPKPVKDKPGFVGFAATLRPDHGAMDFAVPAETVKLVYDSYVSPLLPKD